VDSQCKSGICIVLKIRRHLLVSVSSGCYRKSHWWPGVNGHIWIINKPQSRFAWLWL